MHYLIHVYRQFISLQSWVRHFTNLFFFHFPTTIRNPDWSSSPRALAVQAKFHSFVLWASARARPFTNTIGFIASIVLTLSSTTSAVSICHSNIHNTRWLHTYNSVTYFLRTCYNISYIPFLTRNFFILVTYFVNLHNLIFQGQLTFLIYRRCIEVHIHASFHSCLLAKSFITSF